MMNNPTVSIRIKAVRAWNERVSNLLGDGYHILFKSSGVSDDMWFVSLRHRNGNRVSITACWRKNQLIQRTNGKIVHESTLY